MWDKRVKTIVVNVNSPENLDKAKNLVRQNISIDSMRTVIKNEELKGVTAKSHYFQKGENIDIDETEWKAGVIRVVPSTVDNTTKIIKILEVRQPEPKTFKEARGVVTSAYQAKLEEDWLKELNAKYHPTVDQKVLEKVRNYYK